MSQGIRFLAQNHYLLVNVIEENTEQNNTIVLPDGYKKQENPFKMAVILNAHENSSFYNHIGSYAIFPSNVLEEISLNGINLNIIPEQYVYGILQTVEVNDKE